MNRTNSTNVVELLNVTKHFNEIVAVDNISLDIKQGEFFSLLGPSGCGKTTTLRMVAGFDHPSQGDIIIKGKVVNGVPAYERDTNLVFQQLALFPHLDVYDNIAFGPQVKRKLPRSEITKKVKQVLELVELSGYENRRIQQLSGGQQQRIAIARALINEPSVLLLDEPLGALDLKLRLQMQIELKALQQRVGTTFIYVTHDQGEAITMSDRIAVMNHGRIEQVASSDDIYSKPKTRFVAQFIGDTNLLEGKITEQYNDRFIFDTGKIQINVKPPDKLDISVDDPISLSIRPEKIKLFPENTSPEYENRFIGTIRLATFLGSSLRYEITLDNGVDLVIESLYETENHFKSGERVWATWEMKNNVIVSNT